MDHFVTRFGDSRPSGAVSAVLEDSIMVKGYPATAGSKMLENFISPLDATVVTRLKEAGVNILGKTKMDEFGVAGLFGTSEEGASGAVNAVCDGDAISAGDAFCVTDAISAGKTAIGSAGFALCNDITGAVTRQAVRRGLCYIRPTYGTVSRYGLIPAAASMDQIGIVCKNPEEGFRVLSIISGNDPKDGAMFSEEQPVYGDGLRAAGSGSGGPGTSQAPFSATKTAKDVRSEPSRAEGLPPMGSLRIAIPANIFESSPDADAVREFAKNFDTVDITLPFFNVYAQVMQILCSAEISSNLTRYDGIKFGYRTDDFRDLRELYTKSRTEALGPEAKLAAIVGAMVVSQDKYYKFYDKAMRIRRLIKDSLKFDEYDIIIIPDSARSLALHALPLLCGLPAVTLPLGENGSITLIAGARREKTLYNLLSRNALQEGRSISEI